MRREVLVMAIGVFGFGHLAKADSCDNFKTPTQVLAGLTSTDPVAKLGAKTCGLSATDPVMRGVVLQNMLTGVNTMTFDVEAEPKDTSGAQIVNELPAMTADGITWSADGKTFFGRMVTPNNMSDVYGQFLGEDMSISFNRFGLQPATAGATQTLTSCTATLSMQPGASAMTGTLRCVGIAPRFVISLPL